MSRLIINNRSDLSDLKALEMVRVVVLGGRVSNEDTDGVPRQYCYCTIFLVDGVEYGVSTDLRKGSDSFTVWREGTRGGRLPNPA